MRVLIADDDEITLATLESLLSHLGHEAVRASDGTQAWELLQREDAPSLAILDWMMPGLDGVEICRRLRQQGKKPYQYLIMLTARDEMQDLVESIESGADDYLRKPFDVRELRARLHAAARILDLRDELRARANFDELTGLLNRAGILEALRREFAHVARTGEPATIILADLDNFKAVNDTYGHPAGDEVLREASRRLSTCKRSYDELGRYGGEEFLALLPGCDASSGIKVAGRMRQAVERLPIDTAAGLVSLTASFGVSSVDQIQSLDLEAAVAAADEALYRAKRGGRNRVEGPLENIPAPDAGA
jgi:diguanylate cyclase (GGDEF)-like protein